MIPTLPTLATISRVYGVGMSYFFSEPAKHTLSITRKAHLAGNSRGLESVKTTPLNAVTDGTRLVAQMIEFPAGGASCTTDSCREKRPGVRAGREAAVGCGRNARGAGGRRLRLHGERDGAGLERGRQAPLPDFGGDAG
jgi:hypothetical protein